MAKITLIQPPHILPDTILQLRTSYSPLGLAYIAGTLKDKGHEIHVIDAIGASNKRRRPSGFKGHSAIGLTTPEILALIRPDTQIVGVSAMFATDWKNTKTIIQEIRKKFPEVLIMLGGEQVSSEPEYSLKSTGADIVVIGEGEETAAEVAQRFDNQLPLDTVDGTYFLDRTLNEIRKNPRRKRVRHIDEISRPAWELFPMEAYLTKSAGTTAFDKSKINMIMSRGCPYQCTFCSSPNMWGTNWFPRNADLVINEIRDYKNRYQIEHVEFNDLTAVINRKWTMEFAQKLIDSKLGITWSMPSGTRTEIMDEELLLLLKKSGLNSFCYAPESGSDRILKKIKKRIKKEKMLESVAACKKIGITAAANFIIGYPGERHRDIWQSLGFMIQMAYRGLDDIYLANYCPFPGTELYKEAMEKYGDDPQVIEEIWMRSMDTNYFSPKSHSQYVSDRALIFYTFFMLCTFYTAQFVFRPARVFSFLRNVITAHPKSKLEAVVFFKILKRST